MPGRLFKMAGGGALSLRQGWAVASTLFKGNFKSYIPSPGHAYSAYTGMWGHYVADALQAESTMRVVPGSFPNKTTLTWDVTPDPDWGGVNGYLAISYGNYDGSPSVIVPKQIREIAELTVNSTWMYAGDGSSGLLCELWLTPTAIPVGGVEPKLAEIAFFPRFSPGSKFWLDGLPLQGPGFNALGVSWKVRMSGNPQGTPYIVAYREDYGDIQGDMPFAAFFAYLMAQGLLTGTEWFNGLAFGVEPHHGAGVLTVNTLSVNYVAIDNALTTESGDILLTEDGDVLAFA